VAAGAGVARSGVAAAAAELEVRNGSGRCAICGVEDFNRSIKIITVDRLALKPAQRSKITFAGHTLAGR